MKYVVCFLLLLMSLSSLTARAMEYYPDPVYEKLAPEDHHPMDDMLALAKDGDPRAQLILGDLYSKGKGGFAKDPRKARAWFIESAKNGEPVSLVRLASMAQREKKPLEVYQWYTIAIDALPRGEWRNYAQSARDAWIKDAKLSPEDIDTAKKQTRDWVTNMKKEMLEVRERKNKEENLKKAAVRAEEESKKLKEKLDKNKATASSAPARERTFND